MSIANIFKKLNCRDTKIIPKFSKTSKIIISLVLIVFIGFLAKNILAADNIIKSTQEAQGKGNNAESWQQNAWNTTTVNAVTSLSGPIPFNTDGSVNTTSYVPSGMLGSVNNMIGSLYSPQASGIQYVAQIKDNFLGKTTYAQGVGFNSDNSLQPLLPTWRTFRNIVYSLFSIFFVAIGILIMLRIKISPQAVVTIQNTIPKLITALILITFSYAIAGFVIDLSYFFQGLVVAIMFQAKGTALANGFFGSDNYLNFQTLSNANFSTLGIVMKGAVPFTSIFGLSSIVTQIVVNSIFGTTATDPSSLIAGAAGNNMVGWVLGGIGSVILLLIILILCAMWLIKLWFGLLKAYCFIIYRILVAPFEIAIGAFPNSKLNFSSWFFGLLSRVMIFPIVMVVTIFIRYLTEIVNQCHIWVPSLLTVNTLVKACDNSFLSAAIGLGGLALLAKLPTIVPEAIFSIKQSLFEKAIGEGLGDLGAFKKPVSGTAKFGVNQAGQYIGTNRGGSGPWAGKSAGEKGATIIGKASEFFTRH
jgi:hypothetical protein